MAKGLQALIRGSVPGVDLDEMEREMGNLAVATSPPAQYRKPKALTPEAQQLISESMILAAKELVARATEASCKYRDEALDQHDRVVKWGEALIKQTELAAAEIAEGHAAMRRSAEHFKAAMAAPGETLEDTNEASSS